MVIFVFVAGVFCGVVVMLLFGGMVDEAMQGWRK